jgi:hypothetical protein
VHTWPRPPGAPAPRPPAPGPRPLDRVDATNVGRLLSASATADIADAHVVICARRTCKQVVTSDPDDHERLDPQIGLVVV